MVTLDVQIAMSTGVFGGWFVIDDQDIRLNNGAGHADVSPGEHSYQFWFRGNPGAEIDYDVTTAGNHLVKGKSVISAGRSFNYGTGEFQV